MPGRVLDPSRPRFRAPSRVTLRRRQSDEEAQQGQDERQRRVEPRVPARIRRVGGGHEKSRLRKAVEAAQHQHADYQPDTDPERPARDPSTEWAHPPYHNDSSRNYQATKPNRRPRRGQLIDRDVDDRLGERNLIRKGPRGEIQALNRMEDADRKENASCERSGDARRASAYRHRYIILYRMLPRRRPTQ